MLCAMAPKNGSASSATLINIFFIRMCYFFKVCVYYLFYSTLSATAFVRAPNSGL